MNQLIKRLGEGPCIREELPYKVCGHSLSLANQISVQRIRLSGNKSNRHNLGRLKTVYYLLDDEELAVQKFADVNADALQTIDIRRNSTLDSGLPRGIARKLKALLR